MGTIVYHIFVMAEKWNAIARDSSKKSRARKKEKITVRVCCKTRGILKFMFCLPFRRAASRYQSFLYLFSV